MNLEPRKGRVVVVTGASSGIGRACALRLARRGLTVFAGVRSEADAQSLLQIGLQGLVPIQLDVRDRSTLDAAATTVEHKLCEVGSDHEQSWRLALVNNAGQTFTGPLEFLPLEDLRQQFEINLFGQLAAAQALAPVMRRFGGGRVIFVGSMFGRFAAPFIGPYCASKFALEGLADSFSMEMKPWNVQVSVVEPGITDTPIWGKYDKYTDALFDRLPEQARALYEDSVRRAQQRAVKTGEKGISADNVARTIEKSLSTQRPRARYPVGWDARAGIIGSNFLPRHLLQKLTLLNMNLLWIPRKSR